MKNAWAVSCVYGGLNFDVNIVR